MLFTFIKNKKLTKYSCFGVYYIVIKKNNLNIKGCFIYMPYITEQILDKPNNTYMTKDMIVKSLEIIKTFILY
ncbi:hypothetical protein R4K89_05445 [Brachyspira intermedia]|uniref:pyroglutamyl-peptidase I family protein n=1 Tax=Brachyspira intermedia TaxID=84377 RepID=UPI003005140D